MRLVKSANWVWFFIAAAVVIGLFAPPMVANAAAEAEATRCPIPAQGDVLN